MTKCLTALAALCLTTSAAAQTAPDRDYLLFVGAEGNDQIALLRYGPRGFALERQFRMSTNPTELAGPHGMGVSPDGRYYYVSTAHGTPSGALWKYTTVGDTLVGRVTLGAFPATLQVSPDGQFVYVANFNLYGAMTPSSVSVVYAPEMTEIARLTTCTMPHGSRLNAAGTRHYSACMMDDALVEIDASTLAVSRSFRLARGKEMAMTGAPVASAGAMDHGAMSGHDMTPTAPSTPQAAPCSPTWAQPSPDGAKVYVACNKSNDVVEIDAARWAVLRRIPAGDGVYNLAITRDGRLLVATNKRAQSVSVIDVATGKELARLATKRRVPSGVAISPDDRYAFVTVEGVGAEPGTVEVIDLRALKTVATVDVGPQVGGVDVWKVEPRDR